MIANQILENKMKNEYNKLFNINSQEETLTLNLDSTSSFNGLIMDNSDNANGTYQKMILTPYNTLKTGDYITQTIVRNEKTIKRNYIVNSQIDNEIGADKFFLEECPFSTKLLDFDFNTILEYPITLTSNNASLGVTESAIAITANSNFDIIVKSDASTRRFVRNVSVNGTEFPKITRIMIDSMVFKIVGVNHIQAEGILTLSLDNDNIITSDSISMGVADFHTYYKPSDTQIVDIEIAKYETTAFISKIVIAGTDITVKVKKLKLNEIANTEINVNVSEVDINGLLTLNASIVTLTDQIPFEATDNTTTATLSFIKGTVIKTLIINVNIEKQEEVVAPPDLVISADYADLPIGETNTYTINTSETVSWSITNINGALTLNTGATSNTCTVTCAYDTNYINKTEVITATVNGFDYTYTIYIASLI